MMSKLRRERKPLITMHETDREQSEYATQAVAGNQLQRQTSKNACGQTWTHTVVHTAPANAEAISEEYLCIVDGPPTIELCQEQGTASR